MRVRPPQSLRTRTPGPNRSSTPWTPPRQQRPSQQRLLHSPKARTRKPTPRVWRASSRVEMPTAACWSSQKTVLTQKAWRNGGGFERDGAHSRQSRQQRRQNGACDGDRRPEMGWPGRTAKSLHRGAWSAFLPEREFSIAGASGQRKRHEHGATPAGANQTSGANAWLDGIERQGGEQM